MSASGRYLFVIGRDAKIVLIDMWMKETDTGRRNQGRPGSAFGRDLEVQGLRDKIAIAGTYWPPQYVIMDGDTLKPRKIIGTRGMTSDTNEYHLSRAFAAIVSSHYKPEFLVNAKETGVVHGELPDLDNLKITMIKTPRFLHDGGMEASGRYFMDAANASTRSPSSTPRNRSWQRS